MNKCPVCGLAMGVTLDTCVRCHYNEQKGFKTIEVPVDILGQYMPFDLIANLLVEHTKKYKGMEVIKRNTKSYMASAIEKLKNFTLLKKLQHS